jgi:hypothetical protein
MYPRIMDMSLKLAVFQLSVILLILLLFNKKLYKLFINFAAF